MFGNRAAAKDAPSTLVSVTKPTPRQGGSISSVFDENAWSFWSAASPLHLAACVDRESCGDRVALLPIHRFRMRMGGRARVGSKSARYISSK